MIVEKEKISDQSLMTLGDLFEEHYNHQKDKVLISFIRRIYGTSSKVAKN